MSPETVDESEFFSEEELAMMAAAEASRAAAPPKDLETQLAELQEQIQGLAGFIGEGVRREEELRARVHQLQGELSRAKSAGDIAFTMTELEAQLSEMTSYAARAQVQERNIRSLLSKIREKLPVAISPPS